MGRVRNTQNNTSDDPKDDTGEDKNDATKTWGNTGALVHYVHPDTPAQDSGIRSGDIIVEVAHKQVQGLEDLTFDQDKPGERVQVAIWRNYFPQGWQRSEIFPKVGD